MRTGSRYACYKVYIHLISFGSKERNFGAQRRTHNIEDINRILRDIKNDTGS